MFQLRDHLQRDAHQLLSDYVNPAFAKVLRIIGFDIDYVRGQGAYLYDAQGRQYLDCLAGYGTFGVGRNHPAIREALIEAMQADLPNLPKMGTPKLAGVLAEQLCQRAPGRMDRAFFSNSGAEAVETAMKFARAATGRQRIVYCRKGFHGSLAMGALSINGNDEFRDGFGNLLADTTAIAFNDIHALQQELARGDVAGFVVEPIQGKGVNIPDPDYLPTAAKLCREHRTLLIMDEVQTGLGRTGRLFACEHDGVEPDIICIAKILSGGYIPVAATLTRAEIHKKTFSSLDRCVVHSSTYSGNDLAMVAGLATLAVIDDEQLIDNAYRMGERLMAGLRPLIARYDMVRDVRGRGLMVAIEFGPPKSLKLKAGWKLMHAADKGLFPQAVIIPLLQDHGILTQVAGHHLDVIKLIPPLMLSEAVVDRIIAGFEDVVARCHRLPGPMWEVGKHLTQHMTQNVTRSMFRRPDRSPSTSASDQ